jgi:hypothetical protein
MNRVIALLTLLAAACSSGSSGPTGGPVDGGADAHCTLADGGARIQPTDQASCSATLPDAGALDYGQTLFNAEGDDDDCKYHVRFSATPVRESSDVTFTVVATRRTDGSAATGANIDPEIFLDATHPAPNSGERVSESPPGTYRLGPIRFDAPGRWTVRFHLYETCDDEVATSPHGHIAFYVDVP